MAMELLGDAMPVPCSCVRVTLSARFARVRARAVFHVPEHAAPLFILLSRIFSRTKRLGNRRAFRMHVHPCAIEAIFSPFFKPLASSADSK